MLKRLASWKIMLKRLVSWKYEIAVAVILGCSVYVSRQDQKTRKQYEQKCNQLNASATSPTSHYEDCDKGAENAVRNLPLLYQVLGWPEGITACAILLTLFVIAEQTGQTRKAAEAALESAKAANAQIKMMKDKERARLTVRILPEKIAITDMSWSIKFQIDNLGPTRAFGVTVFARFEFSPSEIPPSIPVLDLIEHLQPIKADGQTEVTTFPTSGEESGENRLVIWDLGRMQNVSTGKTFLHLRGVVAYEDIFEESHVTPFKYRWDADLGAGSWGEEPSPHWVEVSTKGDQQAT